MLYCLVERKNKGGKQINRVELPIELNCIGWESTNKLFAAGKITKAIQEQYAYLSLYEPLDWTAEEDGMSGTDSYYPI